MKIKFVLAIAALTLAGSAISAPIPTNLISNGNFESGTVSPWTLTGNAGISGPAGNAFYYGAGSTAQDGNFIFEFNGRNLTPNGVLSQTFATSVGGNYLLSFQYGTTTGGPQSLMADILNSSSLSLASSTVSASNSSALNGPLSTFSLAFTANSANSTLRFRDVTTNISMNVDGVLDNVSVVSVPEPTSIALLGLGMLGFAASRRKSAK